MQNSFAFNLGRELIKFAMGQTSMAGMQTPMGGSLTKGVSGLGGMSSVKPVSVPPKAPVAPVAAAPATGTTSAMPSATVGTKPAKAPSFV